MPLADALAYIFLIIRHRHFIQFGFRLEVAHTEIDATMLETMPHNGYKTVLNNGIIKRLVKLANRADVAHPFKAFPRHRLRVPDKVR